MKQGVFRNLVYLIYTGLKSTQFKAALQRLPPLDIAGFSQSILEITTAIETMSDSNYLFNNTSLSHHNIVSSHII